MFTLTFHPGIYIYGVSVVLLLVLELSIKHIHDIHCL